MNGSVARGFQLFTPLLTEKMAGVWTVIFVVCWGESQKFFCDFWIFAMIHQQLGNIFIRNLSHSNQTKHSALELAYKLTLKIHLKFCEFAVGSL